MVLSTQAKIWHIQPPKRRITPFGKCLLGPFDTQLRLATYGLSLLLVLLCTTGFTLSKPINSLDDRDLVPSALDSLDRSDLTQANNPPSAALAQLKLAAVFLPGNAEISQQREKYKKALTALNQGQIQTFQSLQKELAHYPLAPYLEYAAVSRQLHTLPYQRVDQFLDTQANTYLGEKLLKDWLVLLDRKRHWHDFQSYYTPDLKDANLSCLQLKARLSTGDELALDEIPALWNVAHSQPKSCDPLFKQWQDGGRQSREITWSRATKAIAERNLKLARYLAKHASADIKPTLDLLLEIDRHPERLTQTGKFANQNPEIQYIILNGVKRLAKRDAVKALSLWERYDAQHLFPDQERLNTQETLILNLTRQGSTEKAFELANTMTDYSNIDMIGGLIRNALANAEWNQAEQWIRRLPAEEQQQPRWRYWSTRAAEIQGHSLPPYASIVSSYTALANERTFYGFLAADRLGQPYQLEDKPTKVSLSNQSLLLSSPSILRAKELNELGYSQLARQEWRYALTQFSSEQLSAAGSLAANWGWHRSGIQAMIDARAWDDLTVRFPLAYENIVKHAADTQSMDVNLLFAIARQESAFSADARSPAGALGLMQLMPATAKQTASKAGIKFTKMDLLQPETNVALGSRYLNEMLERYAGNQAFAAAAYNAGPHRVDQWLSNGRDQLPLDVWIETIPFQETRGYVQNIIVFSVIYAYRNGAEKNELRNGLPASETKNNLTSGDALRRLDTRAAATY